MKKLFIALATLFALVLPSFAQNQNAKNSKSLVVYFSRADENYGVGTIKEGNTAIIAKMIAQKTGSDIFEIVPEKSYPANYKECTDVAMSELRQKARPSYKGDIDTNDYDTIYIGYPIWWGDMPMIVYTFLDAHNLNGKTILPFCTHAGSGLAGTVSSFKSMYKSANVKEGLSISGSTAQRNRTQAEKQVDAWLKK